MRRSTPRERSDSSRGGVGVELIDSANPGDAVSGVLDGSIDVTWGGPMRVMKARDGSER